MKRIILIMLLACLGIFSRIWIGVYNHDEFPEDYFFVKHKPTWKWRFYSPIGMSDLKIENLTPEKQNEELLFKEFVRDRELSR